MSRQKFFKQSEIEASVERVFAFHEEPSAIKLLTPPWERVEFVKIAESLKPGTRTIIKLFVGPFSKTWIAEHTEYIPNQLFADTQISGPFAYWYHRHRFQPTERATTIYTDEVEYRLPVGWLGELLAGGFAHTKLERMFDYRHKVVAEEMRNRR